MGISAGRSVSLLVCSTLMLSTCLPMQARAGGGGAVAAGIGGLAIGMILGNALSHHGPYYSRPRYYYVRPVVHASADVAAVQKALAYYSLYNGPIDGVAGPGYRAAIQALQQKAGWAMTGALSPDEHSILLTRYDTALKGQAATMASSPQLDQVLPTGGVAQPSAQPAIVSVTHHAVPETTPLPDSPPATDASANPLPVDLPSTPTPAVLQPINPPANNLPENTQQAAVEAGAANPGPAHPMPAMKVALANPAGSTASAPQATQAGSDSETAQAFFAKEMAVQSDQYSGLLTTLGLDKSQMDTACHSELASISGAPAAAAPAGTVLPKGMLDHACRTWAYASGNTFAMYWFDRALGSAGDSDAASRVAMHTLLHHDLQTVGSN